MSNNEFISDLTANLVYSFKDRDLQLILNEVNKTLANYTVNKIPSFSLVSADDYNEQLLNRYIFVKDMSGISKNSLEQYVRQSRKFLETINKRACDVTENDAKQYLFTYKYQHGVTNTTLNNMRMYINNFFTWMFDEELIQRNPFAKMGAIKGDTIRDTAITKIEEEKLYSACDNLRDRAIMEVLFATGVRVSELVNIKLEDIDFYGKTIHVIGKGHKERTVCISDKAIYHVQAYLESRPCNSAYLFIGKRAPYNKISVDAVQSMLKTLGKKAKVENVHPHRFRSTAATRWIDAGMEIHQVSKLLGHSDISTTMIYYRGNFNLSADYRRITNI